jgi:hypothetical protein
VLQILGYVLPFVAFLALYALLREREKRKSGSKPPVQWGWLAAIMGCALVALIVALVA